MRTLEFQLGFKSGIECGDCHDIRNGKARNMTYLSLSLIALTPWESKVRRSADPPPDWHRAPIRDAQPVPFHGNPNTDETRTPHRGPGACACSWAYAYLTGVGLSKYQRRRIRTAIAPPGLIGVRIRSLDPIKSAQRALYFGWPPRCVPVAGTCVTNWCRPGWKCTGSMPWNWDFAQELPPLIGSLATEVNAILF